MRKVVLWGLFAAVFLLMAPGVQALTIDLTGDRGDSYTTDDGAAVFIEFTEAMQTTVSSGTGVIDPFLTIRKKGTEEGFNSDAIPLVLDTTRPKWNHSIQISDLALSPIPGYSSYYEFLLDINEPAATSEITQTELEVYVVDNSVDDAAAIVSYSDLESSGVLIWDLNGLEDSQILYDYNLWSGSGQNIDAAFLLDMSLFSGYSPDFYVYLYAKFEDSADGFEEYALRKGVIPVPEPATLILLGVGMMGVAGVARRSRG
jgi:hypothetical protein